MFTRTTRLMFAMLLALPACEELADDDFAVKEATGATSDGESDGESDAGSEEAGTQDTGGEGGEEDGEPAAPPELLGTCDLQVPCEFPVELVRESASQTYAASDLCALKVLGGEPNSLVQTVAAFASAESYLDHVVIGPDVVLRQAYGRSDGLGLWHKPVERCVLKPPAFFAACAESFDPNCLDPQQWVESCEALDSLTCPEP
jgi:hypothetical protein